MFSSVVELSQGGLPVLQMSAGPIKDGRQSQYQVDIPSLGKHAASSMITV